MKCKSVIAAILVAIFIPVLLSACAGGNNEAKEYTAIVSAMDNEIEHLLKEADIERVETIAGTQYHIGTLRKQPVIITKAGIGKVRAASCTSAMFNKFQVSRVVFTGIAGGIRDDEHVLDQVIATRLLQHDYGTMSNDGFIWNSGDPGAGYNGGEFYYPDKELTALAYKAAVEVVGKEHVFKGTIATGDQFVASQSYVDKLEKEYDAFACEMEGAAVAVVCEQYEKPFAVIRALSDKADGKAHDSYTDFGDKAGEHSSRIVLKMLEYLGSE
ncbi:MAG: 5'-methylthioadenosine/adenosylhomocysteine nucleosidase [Ruminococcaceae bacterium]|nr:5'-methylthioadenosine/adenosylhomocysteine nucleosidase [Oscillospiraceae bacterium]